jgi:ABC-2 type transport system permease protein
MDHFFILRVLDWFEPLFIKLGIEYKTMRRILQVKLTMDQRRKPTVFQHAGKKKNKDKPEKNEFFKSLWIYGFFGLMLIPFLFFKENYLFQLTILFSIFMFIVMTTLISDFSSVLLDLRDKSVLSTKPVNSKTVSMAKLLHVVIYMMYITLAITLIPLVVSIFVRGILFSPLLLVSFVLADVFIIAFTALLYLFILRFFDGEKLKDIINYVQIALSIAMMIGYQVVARSFELVNLDYKLDFAWWHLLLPPMWFGGLFDLLLGGKTNTGTILMTVFAVIGPVLSIVVYLKMIPEFERNLQKLSSQTGKKKSSTKWKALRSVPLLVSNDELPFFRFASTMMKNERDFKLKVYPSLGFALVIPFVFMFNSYSMMDFAEFTVSRNYMTIYSVLLVIPASVMMLGHSGSYKGSWVYQVAPLTNQDIINKAALKAFLFQLFLPLFLLLSVVFGVLFGLRIADDLLLALVAALFYTALCFQLGSRELAFSQPFDAVQQSGDIKIFLLFLIIPVMVGLHFLALKFQFGVVCYALLLFVANWVLWRKLG